MQQDAAASRVCSTVGTVPQAGRLTLRDLLVLEATQLVLVPWTRCNGCSAIAACLGVSLLCSLQKRACLLVTRLPAFIA